MTIKMTQRITQKNKDDKDSDIRRKQQRSAAPGRTSPAGVAAEGVSRALAISFSFLRDCLTLVNPITPKDIFLCDQRLIYTL